MLSTLKKILPRPLKKLARSLIKLVKYRYRRHAIKKPVKQGEKIKIIIGAAETYRHGWYPTNEQWLDITKYSDWKAVFNGKKILTHVVAEHVFEHLTLDESKKALNCIYEYLTEQGRIRIAVPDGYNPDPTYIKHVGINGIGDDADDHKQLLNVDTLMALLQDAGFKPAHIEGYDHKGQLVQKSYSVEDGFIMRSRANPTNVKNNPWNFPDSNTSLIVDGIKANK